MQEGDLMPENIFAKELTIIHQDGTIDTIFKTEENQYEFLNYIFSAISSNDGLFFHTMGHVVEQWEGVLYFPELPTLEQEKIMRMILELGKRMKSFCTRKNIFVYPFQGESLSLYDFNYPKFVSYDFKDWKNYPFVAIAKEDYCYTYEIGDFVNFPIAVMKEYFQKNCLLSYMFDDSSRALGLPFKLSFYQRSFLFNHMDYLNAHVKELFVGMPWGSINEYYVDHDLYTKINFSTDPSLVESLRRYR